MGRATPKEIEARLGHPGLLGEVKAALGRAFGERLKGVVLYGSQARGEARPESDVDLLIVLQGPVRYGEDLGQIIGATHDLQMEVDAELAATPVDETTYEEGDWPLYRHARREGVAL